MAMFMMDSELDVIVEYWYNHPADLIMQGVVSTTDSSKLNIVGGKTFYLHIMLG